MRPTRRQVIAGGAAVLALGAVAGWRYPMSRSAYEERRAEMIRPLPEDPGFEDLVRYATLAASGHNTQPWTFHDLGDAIAIRPDHSRATPVVDPDDHHLYASLGCAAETLSLAARARGRSGEIETLGAQGLTVSLTRGAAEPSRLFDAIPRRQSTRAAFDGTAAPAEAVARLEEAVRAAGVEPVLFPQDRLEPLTDLVVAGNDAQFADPAFRAELKRWIRFNPRAAARTGDGLYAASSGNPTLPDWLGPLVFDLVVGAEGESRKAAAQMQSSAGAVVLVAPTDDPAGWIAAGRAAQRMALQATADGLKVSFLNQPVENAEARARLKTLIGTDRRPNLVLRFGRGPAMPPSLRRPVAQVIAPA